MRCESKTQSAVAVPRGLVVRTGFDHRATYLKRTSRCQATATVTLTKTPGRWPESHYADPSATKHLCAEHATEYLSDKLSARAWEVQ